MIYIYIYIEYCFLDSDLTSPGLFPHCLCWKFTEVAHDDCTLLQQDWTVGICSPHQGCYVKTFSAQAFSEGCDKRRCAFQPAPFGEIGFLRGFTKAGEFCPVDRFTLKKSVHLKKSSFKENKDEFYKLGQSKLQRCEQWVVSQPPNRSSWTPFCQRSFPGQACHPKGTNAPFPKIEKRAALFWITVTKQKKTNQKNGQNISFRHLYFLPSDSTSYQISTEHVEKKGPNLGPCLRTQPDSVPNLHWRLVLAHVHS